MASAMSVGCVVSSAEHCGFAEESVIIRQAQDDWQEIFG